MDIEGSECDVLENMLDDQIFPKYLAVEFDLGFNGENMKDIDKCNKIIHKLFEHNYELIYQNHSDFTFKLNGSSVNTTALLSYNLISAPSILSMLGTKFLPSG